MSKLRRYLASWIFAFDIFVLGLIFILAHPSENTDYLRYGIITAIYLAVSIYQIPLCGNQNDDEPS